LKNGMENCHIPNGIFVKRGIKDMFRRVPCSSATHGTLVPFGGTLVPRSSEMTCKIAGRFFYSYLCSGFRNTANKTATGSHDY
jgi:hypothetical protein